MKKNLVNLIEKLAQSIDDPMPESPRARRAPRTPEVISPRELNVKHPATAPYKNTGANAVKEMQVAIQRLAKTISNSIDYDSLRAGLNGKGDAKSFEKSYGKDSFTNFMVNRYLRNADVKGQEFDTDPTKTKMQDKKPSELMNMSAILDGLNRIGLPSKEPFADGNWGPRTNNALKNVAAIADAVVKVGKQLGMESKAFDLNKVAALGSLIPGNEKELKPEEFATRAAEITKILNGVQQLFLDFKDQVLSKPAYMSFFNGDRPVFEVGPAKQQQPYDNETQKSIYNSLKDEGANSRFVSPLANIQIPSDYTGGKAIQPSSISAADLINTKTFDAWATKIGLGNLIQTNPDTWKSLVPIILDQVKQQIQKQLQGPQEATPLQTTR